MHAALSVSDVPAYVHHRTAPKNSLFPITPECSRFFFELFFFFFFVLAVFLCLYDSMTNW